MKYPINEVFETIQGEATYTGTPSVFLRFQGCPVGCPWCDTKHTWDVEEKNRVAPAIMLLKEEDSAQYASMTADEVLEMLDSFSASHIVITGGEPCLYDLIELTAAICDSGRTCQIETSGTHTIECDSRVFVTVSPKIGMPGGLEVLPEAYARANEVKYPMGKESDLLKITDNVLHHLREGVPLWLQPLSQSPKATALCVRLAIESNWKVSIQTHKYLGVR